jgi:hypothetical protein
MPCDLRRQVLRQRAQLGARVGVQFLAGDVVRQQRIIVPGAFLLLVPRPPVLPVARRPVGASAVLGTLRTASSEGPVPVSRTPFAPALEPAPALAVVTVLEPAILRPPLEPAILRAPHEPALAGAAIVTPRLVVTPRPVVTVLEAALALAATGTSLTPRPGGAAETPFPALAALTAELPLPGLAPARPVEPPLAGPASLPFEPPLARLARATALAAETPFAGLPRPASLPFIASLARPALAVTALTAETALA